MRLCRVLILLQLLRQKILLARGHLDLRVQNYFLKTFIILHYSLEFHNLRFESIDESKLVMLLTIDQLYHIATRLQISSIQHFHIFCKEAFGCT